MLNEFRKFAMRGNVVDMAVGIVIGTAFTKIVTSLVQDVIMPPIGLALGRVDFSQLYIDLTATGYPTLKAAQEAGAATINYGMFVNAVINFMIVAFAIFMVVKAMNTLVRREKETPPEPAAQSPEVVLLTEIRDALRKGEESAG